MYKCKLKCLFALSVFWTFVSKAADTSTGSALPYESWLKTLQQSLTGPVAFSVSLIGIVSCGATLIFTGGEISRFMRSIIYIVLVMTMLVGANSLMSGLFNGACVTYDVNLQQKIHMLKNTAPVTNKPQNSTAELQRFMNENQHELC